MNNPDEQDVNYVTEFVGLSHSFVVFDCFYPSKWETLVVCAPQRFSTRIRPQAPQERLKLRLLTERDSRLRFQVFRVETGDLFSRYWVSLSKQMSAKPFAKFLASFLICWWSQNLMTIARWMANKNIAIPFTVGHLLHPRTLLRLASRKHPKPCNPIFRSKETHWLKCTSIVSLSLSSLSVTRRLAS